MQTIVQLLTQHMKLVESVFLKHIANELLASDSFVGRQLLRAERDFKPNFHWLPEVILTDEVKKH